MEHNDTIVNKPGEYEFDMGKHRCCARLANNLNKQCSYSVK